MGTVHHIPAGEPFVDALARGLLREGGGDAMALADVLVLLPTRRACRALRDAFVRENGRGALLLPRIEPLGDVDPDEVLGAAAAEIAIPPAIAPLRRRLLLARLLAPVEPHLPHRLRLAAELALLLDELESEGARLEGLDAVVPGELAAHWEHTRALLACIQGHWPAILEQEEAIDPADRRDRLLRSVAARLPGEGADRRVVAAGSTGSVPATRALLAAVLALSRGALVLPGLDLGLDDGTFDALPPTHPQYGLKELLGALGVARSAVTPWPGSADGSSDGARMSLIRDAMRPATAIRAAPGVRSEPGVSGLVVHDVRDQGTEALLLAVLMREALEVPGRTAALVTPDRALARRVAVELRRFGVVVDDSAGTPLDRTPAGTFLLLLAKLLDGVAPVPLLALLKHPLARPGEDRDPARTMVGDLERLCLRGPHVADGFAGIRGELDRAERRTKEDNTGRRRRIERLRPFVDRIEETLLPLIEHASAGETRLNALLRAHVAVGESLAAAHGPTERGLFGGDDGEAAAELCRELDAALDPDVTITPRDYPAFVAGLMAERPVRPHDRTHPRLAILGQLEARLQQADLMLVGGMNEAVWPGPVDGGPWLSRSMRDALGLPPVERRVGLAAHDVQQLLAAPEVVVTRAERDAGGNPTVPSRWLVRLRALLGSAGRDDRPARIAGVLDRPSGPTAPVSQPSPRPPLAARPRRLSVSDVGSWMRDPYALYAKRILALRPLEPLEADPGALERGILIHEVLEAFVRAHPDVLPDDALERLSALGAERFLDFAHRPQVRALWWPRFQQAARWFLEQERQRRPELARLAAEVAGEVTFDTTGGPFTLTARADRIERDRSGQVTIIDYKTGTLPKRPDVVGGRQPQLPLEAWMLIEAGFRGHPAAAVRSLRFWSLRGDVQGGKDEELTGDTAELATQAAAGLRSLVDHYDNASTPYPARLRPDMTWQRDYDHLARFKEWAG